MKKYLKPQITENNINMRGDISSLNDWLASTGMEYQDAGITTFTIVS